jgi:hypothetical protein
MNVARMHSRARGNVPTVPHPPLSHGFIVKPVPMCGNRDVPSTRFSAIASPFVYPPMWRNAPGEA